MIDFDRSTRTAEDRDRLYGECRYYGPGGVLVDAAGCDGLGRWRELADDEIYPVPRKEGREVILRREKRRQADSLARDLRACQDDPELKDEVRLIYAEAARHVERAVSVLDGGEGTERKVAPF